MRAALRIRRPRWLRGTELSIIRLRPGDTVVLTCPVTVTMQQAEMIGARAQRAWPDHRVVVITNGVYVTAVRPEDAPA